MQFDDDLLMAFVELEKKNIFFDKRDRNFKNVIKLLVSSTCSNSVYVKKSLKELINLGLLTRITDVDVSLRSDNLVSLIYYTKENKKKFKEIYDRQGVVKYHNDEFVALSLE